jgi:hypothetical protein
MASEWVNKYTQNGNNFLWHARGRSYGITEHHGIKIIMLKYQNIREISFLFGLNLA